jgi:hypothetical protein
MREVDSPKAKTEGESRIFDFSLPQSLRDSSLVRGSRWLLLTIFEIFEKILQIPTIVGIF